MLVERPDHVDREGSGSAEHFGDTSARADIRLEVLGCQPRLFHAKPDGRQGCRRRDRKVLVLISLDERR